jgi:hypothetical protein
MKRGDRDPRPNTCHSSESVPLRDVCDLDERPDLRVSREPHLKPNLGWVLQGQRTGSIRCGAGSLGNFARRLEWTAQ